MSLKEPRSYSPGAFTRILFEMAYMTVKFKGERRLISKKFRTDIMLAVTYVNGCRLCSYVHTRALLRDGASDEELKPLLEGTFENLNTEETTALVFAQHYAETGGNYDPAAFQRVKDRYGDPTAAGILTAVRMIMFGNVNGIALGSLWDRIRFRKVQNPRLLREIYNAFSPLVLLPVFLLANTFRRKRAY